MTFRSKIISTEPDRTRSWQPSWILCITFPVEKTHLLHFKGVPHPQKPMFRHYFYFSMTFRSKVIATESGRTESWWSSRIIQNAQQ
jgi:hypothetical protein